jgi:hypothetical protein
LIIHKASIAEYIKPFAATTGVMTLSQVLAEVIWPVKLHFRITLVKLMDVNEMLVKPSVRWGTLKLHAAICTDAQTMVNVTCNIFWIGKSTTRPVTSR